MTFLKKNFRMKHAVHQMMTEESVERCVWKGNILMKKIAHLLFGRFALVGVAILLQVSWLFVVLWKFSYQFTYANLFIRAIAIILVLVIVNRWSNPANKLSWTFLILLSPILGTLLYFLFGRSDLTKYVRRHMEKVNQEVSDCLTRDMETEKLLEETDASVYHQSKYINDFGHFPVYRNTSTKYYKSGEDMFPDMLDMNGKEDA